MPQAAEQIAAVSARGATGSRRRLAGVAATLTGANVLGAASGFITGPLLARALGASGRGDLAAIVVPFTLAAPIVGLGIPSYAYIELPRGRPVGEIIGSLGPPLVLIGALVAATSVPIADALAGGRATVRVFLIIGFVSMPVVLLSALLLMSLGALERWRRVAITKLAPFAVMLAGVVALYAAGRLTVANAAALSLAGSLLSIAPGLSLLREQRLRFRFSLMRSALAFGVKSWLGGLAQIGNARLDQFLMITAVAPAELGRYAVAVTISGASGLASGGVMPPLMARIAAGDTRLMSQATRIMILSTVALNVLLALAAPVMLAVLFGPQFHGALVMTWILLAAQVPLSAAMVLSSALQADGAPMIPTFSEAIALAITVPGLIVLLGPLGGVGAAIVSVAAYGASFVFQVFMARRHTGIPVTEFILIRGSDMTWARGRLLEATARLRSGR